MYFICEALQIYQSGMLLAFISFSYSTHFLGFDDGRPRLTNSIISKALDSDIPRFDNSTIISSRQPIMSSNGILPNWVVPKTSSCEFLSHTRSEERRAGKEWSTR